MADRRKDPKDYKSNAGRPRKVWSEADCEKFKQLLYMQCDEEECCAVMGVTTETLHSLINAHLYKDITGKAEGGPVGFCEARKRYGANGRASLRRMLFKQAEKNPGAAIFLAKNLLGMKDNPNQDTGGSPVQVIDDVG